MSRWVAGAAAVAAITLGLPGVAVAAAPPSLGGESLAASPSSSPGGPWSLSSGSSFNFNGEASGPYVGSFIETGTATYDLSQWCGCGQISVPLQSFMASFTIITPTATVSGTETMTGTATAQAFESAGGGGEGVGPVTVNYKATITTGGQRYTDQGTSQVTVDQSEGGDADTWYGTLSDGPMVSSSIPVQTPPPPVLTLSNPQISATGSTVLISVDASPDVINTTLETPSGAKVANDDTPVNGVASWTLTGVPAGTYTYKVVGYDTPPGVSPAKQSAPVQLTVNVPGVPVTDPLRPSPNPTPTTPPSPSPSPSPQPPTPSVHKAAARLSAFVQANFSSNVRYTEVLALLVRKVPAGATVRVTCTGRGCPPMTRTFTATHGGTINLRAFRDHRLHVGDHLTITISRAGQRKRYSYVVRARRVLVAHQTQRIS